MINLTFPDTISRTYLVAPEPEQALISITAVSKLKSEDEYAEIVIIKLPLVTGKTTDAEVGVMLNPVPSGAMLLLSEQITVDEPIFGRI